MSAKKHPDDRPHVQQSACKRRTRCLARSSQCWSARERSTTRSSSSCRITARRWGCPTTRCSATNRRSKVCAHRLMVADFGHGQSVLSPVQYQVLLGFRTFGSGAGFEARGRDLAGRRDGRGYCADPAGPDACPRRPAVGHRAVVRAAAARGAGRDARGSAERVRFTETDLRVLPSTDGGVDEVATREQNSQFFEVDQQSGRMSVRRSFMPLVLAYKERAAFTDDLLLAAMPAGPDAHSTFCWIGPRGNGRLLLEPPPDRSRRRSVGSGTQWRRSMATCSSGREHHDGGLAHHRGPVGSVLRHPGGACQGRGCTASCLRING